MPYIPAHDRPPYHGSLPTPPRNIIPTSPHYASPDLDPNLPYHQFPEQPNMSSQSGEGYEEAQNFSSGSAYVPRQRVEDHGNGNTQEYEESEAGPSRKRQRQHDNNGYQHGYEEYQDRSTEPVPQHAHGPSANTPLTGSIFNVPPRNPFTSVVGDFILHHAQGLENVEIEVKLGTLMNATDLSGTQPPRRIRMPTQSEMIMPPDYPLGPFHSTMHPQQHRSLNALLNRAAQESATLPPHLGRVHFSRSKLTDTFYGNGSRKVRVSRDRETNQIVPGGIVRKRRIADLNVYCPGMPFDWRVSVNVEEPCEMPAGPPNIVRDKDRACYRHQVCQVDLTHVMTKSENPNAKPTSSFELEIEILDVPALIAEGAAGSDRFDEIIQNVLDTARMLVKNSDAGT